MTRSLAVLLLKYPRAGEVKRRLACELGDEVATELCRCFIEDELSALEASGVRHAISFYPPGALLSLRAWLGPSLSYYPQRGRDHPERLMNTLIDAFSRGEDRVVVMASDVPDIDPDVIREADLSLRESDAVIAPSPDGGYYLIGFRREAFRKDAFTDIAWSTERTFSDTAAKLTGLNVHLLPQWPDVDTASDLEPLARCDRNPAFRSSRTMGVMTDLGLVRK